MRHVTYRVKVEFPVDDQNDTAEIVNVQYGEGEGHPAKAIGAACEYVYIHYGVDPVAAKIVAVVEGEDLPTYTFDGKVFETAEARDEYIRAVMNDKED